MRPGTGSDSGTPNRIAKKTRVTAIAGTNRVSVTFSPSAAKMRPARQRADDRADLERDDEESGGAAGLRRARAGAAAAVEDQRHLERQPDHVEALQRPGDEEASQKSPANASHQLAPGGEHGRDEQDPLVPVHVAELGEDRHDERREQQLRGLEPVEVGVVDAEVLDEVGDQRNVVALQDAARELDEEEEADEAAVTPTAEPRSMRSASRKTSWTDASSPRARRAECGAPRGRFESSDRITIKA